MYVYIFLSQCLARSGLTVTVSRLPGQGIVQATYVAEGSFVATQSRNVLAT